MANKWVSNKNNIEELKKIYFEQTVADKNVLKEFALKYSEETLVNLLEEKEVIKYEDIIKFMSVEEGRKLKTEKRENLIKVFNITKIKKKKYMFDKIMKKRDLNTNKTHVFQKFFTSYKNEKFIEEKFLIEKYIKYVKEKEINYVFTYSNINLNLFNSETRIYNSNESLTSISMNSIE